MGTMSINEILDRSVDILRKQIKNILLFNLIYYFGTGIILSFIIGFGVIFASIISVATNNFIIMIVVLALTFLIFGTIRFAGNVGNIKLAASEFTNEKTSLGDAFLTTLKNLHRVLGVFICLIILFIPIGLLLWGALYLLFGGAGWYYLIEETILNSGWVFVVLLILLIILFSFVFLLYSTIFSLSLQAVVLEKLGVIKAVKKSFILVTSSLWRNFGVAMLIRLSIYGIQYSLTSVVMLVLVIIYTIASILGAPAYSLAYINIIGSLGSFPIQVISVLFLLPLGTIMTTLLYFNLRFRREGYDLSLRLAKIKENTKGSN